MPGVQRPGLPCRHGNKQNSRGDSRQQGGKTERNVQNYERLLVSLFLHVGGHTCEHIPQKHTLKSENMQKQKGQMRFSQRLRAPDTG